jgi:8-oxo-dGTP pyrophosphatase MutT (NUDIX family)
MTSYVLIFAWHNQKLVLIKKNRPEFLKGRWNGIGGKIETGETPEAAAVREFKEETGGNLTSLTSMPVITADTYSIHVFTGRTDSYKTTTDEDVDSFSIAELGKMFAHNPHVFAPDVMAIVSKIVEFD